MAYSNKNYLDLNGLSRYDELIKEYIPITHGYYYNGGFYADSSHTTSITGEAKRLYIDLTNNFFYEYVGNIYVRLGGSNAVISDTQPSGQKAGDVWFKFTTISSDDEDPNSQESQEP